MISARTKQINVYGKRSKRVVDAPTTEHTTSSTADKPDRIPLIHRMKNRENGPNTVKSAIRSKPSSPLRTLSLTKQRVMPSGSPARKGIKRGTRLAEILAQETGGRPASDFNDWEDCDWKKSIPETPLRVPLSAIIANVPNSPLVSNAKVSAKAPKKKDGSPRSLVTSIALSTVEMDIRVLDAKGRTVKQEKRVARTDVTINHANKLRHPSGVDVVAARKHPPARRLDAPKPLETISIGSSIDEPLQPDVHGTSSKPIALSSGSSAVHDSEVSTLKLRPVRKQRRALTNVIISDDDDDDHSEDASDDEDTQFLPDSPAPPLACSSRKSLAQSRKSTVHKSKTSVPAPLLHKPSGLKVEVVIPPAPHKVPPQLTPRSPSRITQQHKPQPIPAKRPKPPASETTVQPAIPSRYSSTTATYTASYNLIPSPPLKARQLTPIRRIQNKGPTKTSSLFAYGRGTSPSPTTPSDTDFDLSLELSQLDIGIASEELEALRLQSSKSRLDYPEYLKPLLEECHQEDCGPYEFSAFIESFPFDPILRDARETSSRRNSELLRFKKIGEASYSEVFGIGDVVLKVIPLRDESRFSGEEEDGPAPTDARDVRKEIIVTRAMGEVHEGFVKLLKTYVVRGKYPEVLLNLWDEYNETKGSESVRPDTFTPSQTYAIIVLPNDGPDLETYTFSNASKTGWRKASSLFWQVAKALAHAEMLVSFEHRDLHWGQILVKDLQPLNKPAPLRSLAHKLNQNQVKGSTVSMTAERVFMDDLGHGVQATIIDLGLSRVDAGDGSHEGDVHWTPFDEEVFMGEGDYQFDIYRFMKAYIGDNWEGYHPLTNVMWLHYLATKLLRHKSLKAPPVARKPRLTSTVTTPIDPLHILQNIKPTSLKPSPSNTQFTEKDCYDALVDIEEWLGRCVAEVAPAVNKGRRRPRKTTAVVPTTASKLLCSCAGQVVGYGVKRGWIRPVS
ncbi:hypothetical protein D9756_000196 [Leucocoprinus leucothites]|uniref:non-specific serine/threonine protein kinase n=1 Tax=Leucocoprinus leucothites TaxID=201217 RepID=A0A8H5LNL1_9AGAR|nr:hypothetical protein D9756_000196 [Leucoagaricus leucothites]